MNENDVDVKYPTVPNGDAVLNKKSYEHSNRAGRLGLFIIIIEFVEISVHLRILIGNVDHHDEHEVHNGKETVPRNNLAENNGEAINTSL